MKNHILSLSIILLSFSMPLSANTHNEEASADCDDIFHLKVTHVSSTSAYITWHAPSTTLFNSFTIEVEEQGSTAFQSYTTNDQHYFLVNLLENTFYNISVYGSCDNGESNTLELSFRTDCLHGGGKKFLYGETNSFWLPIHNNFNYSLSQSIFFANEMSGIDTIKGISLDYRYYGDMMKKNNVKIYLGHTTQNEFYTDPYYNWVSANAFTLVYSGNLNCREGLNYFTFDSSFIYNGTDNLVICFDDHSGTCDNDAHVFGVHYTSSELSLASGAIFSNPTITSPVQRTATSYSFDSRPNIVFWGACGSVSIGCFAPNFVAVSSTTNSVDVVWSSNNNGDSFELEYREKGDAIWNNLGTFTTTSHTISGLNENTTYEFRIRALCSGTITKSDWATDRFTTKCPPIVLPYNENFDSYSSDKFPPCWRKYSTAYNNSIYNYIYPVTSSTEHFSPPYSLDFYDEHDMEVNGRPVIAILPPVEDAVSFSDLVLTVNMKVSYMETPIEIGIVDNIDFPLGFEVIQTIFPENANTWKNYSIHFADYQGSGKHLAFKTRGRSRYFVDDILLREMPACYPPFDITVSNITSHSALLNWSLFDISTPATTHIDLFEDDTLFFASFSTPDPYFLISGLNENSSYLALLYGNCNNDGFSDTIPIRFTTERCPLGEGAECDTISCHAVDIIVTEANNGDLKIAWPHLSSPNVTYELEYKSQYDRDWTQMIFSASVSEYTFQGLLGNTYYTFRMRVHCNDSTFSEWSETIYRTGCWDYMAIPYYEYFDNDGTTDSSFPNCWNMHAELGLHTHISPNYSVSAPGSLFLRDPVVAVAPPIDTQQVDLQSLMITFECLAESTGCQVEVGLMSDPNDTTTFDPIAIARPNSGGSWEFFAIYLDNYQGNGTYPALRVYGSSAYINVVYIDNFTVDYEARCFPARNIKLSNNNFGSIKLSWTHNFVPYSSGYTVQYKTEDDSEWLTENTSDTEYILTNLQENSSYTVRVRPTCSSDEYDYAYAQFQTTCFNFGDVAFKDGDSDLAAIPVYSKYKNSLSQQIFLSEEMDGSREIHSISLNCKRNPPVGKDSIRIFLGHTQKDFFAGYTDWDTASLTLVYSGSLNCTVGWNTFIFDTLFHYNGIDNLIWVTEDNSGSSQSSTSIFGGHYTLLNQSIIAYSDISNYTAGVYPLSETWFPSTARNDIIFHSDCNPVSCSRMNMIVDNITDTSADIQFIPYGTPDNWYFAYQCAGDEDWIEYPYMTDSMIHLSGLQLGSLYKIKSFSRCSADDSSAISTLTFTTSCGKIKYIPFTESFDHTRGNLPCWNLNTSIPYYYEIFIDNDFGLSPHASLSLRNSKYNTISVTLPEIDSSLNINKLSIHFDIFSHDQDQKIEIGVADDPFDISTFTVVDVIPISRISTWLPVTVSFASYNGTGKYIAFNHVNESTISTPLSYLHINVDNVVVDSLSCCFSPSNVNITNIGVDNVSIQWDSIPEVYGYEIYVDTVGFNSITTTPIFTMSASTTISGLTPNTKYELCVRTICHPGDTSGWSYILPFQTHCTPLTINDIPYTEGFDDWGFGEGTLPDCWSIKGGDRYGGRSIYLTKDYHAPHISSLVLGHANLTRYFTILPRLDHTISIANLAIKMNMQFRYENAGPLIIGVMTDPENIYTNTPIAYIYPETINVFEEYEAYLSNYSGSGEYLTITTENSIRIDELSLIEMPSCPIPINPASFNVMANSALIEWQQAGAPQYWILEYDTVEFTPGNGSFQQIINSNSFQWNGLQELTTYYYYIRAYCGVGDTSSYTRVRSFTTICGPPRSIPHSENFDSYPTDATISQEGILPPCWYAVTDSKLPAPHIITGGPGYHPSSGTQCLSMATGKSGKNTYAVFPEFAVPISELTLSFNYKFSELAGTLYIGCLTGGDQENTNTFVPLAVIPRSLSSFSFDFSRVFNLPENATHIALYWYYGLITSIDITISIDDIVLDYATIVCDHPSNFSARDINGRSATISWSPSIDAISYILEYKEETDTIYTTISTTDTSYILQNLTPETNYQVRITSICPEEIDTVYLNGDFTTAPLERYTIIASAGENGNIVPSGTVAVYENENQTFHFEYNNNMILSSLIIDNETHNLPTTDSYTFENVTKDHTIHIDFKPNSINTYVTKDAINIYPNPAKNMLKVATTVPFKNFQLINLMGQILIEGSATDLYFEINIADLKSGIYLIRL
ncbi:fibronectin type III domain-containing protein, partial [Bacteroidales bacterium OttesenSCG-928-B11]|nr:fibronectin type III domain-containing protein [Bacteroidales bacterium OttesenSCG-928-B11]MDL2326794.1 fibronectin type III domain-containing protein [Bacteroidales bacterium OttesenSCG-928-A14]